MDTSQRRLPPPVPAVLAGGLALPAAQVDAGTVDDQVDAGRPQPETKMPTALIAAVDADEDATGKAAGSVIPPMPLRHEAAGSYGDTG